MIDPKPYIAFVDALNELEQRAKKIKRFGLPTTVGEELSKAFEDYSIQWDSEADRWTLISETDDAPNLCSFNQVAAECSELDLCEQCYQLQAAYGDALDERAAYNGN